MNDILYLKLLSAIKFHLEISSEDLQVYLNEQYTNDAIRGLANLTYESNLNSLSDFIQSVNALAAAYFITNPQYNTLEREFIKFYCKLNGIHDNKSVNALEMYNQYQFLLQGQALNRLPLSTKKEVARLMLYFYFALQKDFTELSEVLELSDE